MVEIGGKKYFTTKDVMQIFGVCQDTVKDWRKKGRLQFSSTGQRKYWYTEEQLQAFIEARETVCST